MTTKNIRKNINFLRALRDRHTGRVPTSIQQKINNVVDLYEDRRISQLTTAENLINGIATNNQKQRTKGLKQYEKAIEKYESATPITERMKATAEKAREGKVVKNLRTRLREKTKASAVSRLVRKARERGFGKSDSYSISYMLFTAWDDDSNYNKSKSDHRKALRMAFSVNGIKYYPLHPREGNRFASIKTTPFIESIVGRKITGQKETAGLFKKVMRLLARDVESKLYGYINAVVIYNATKIDNEEDFDIKAEGLKKTSNV